LCIFIFRRVSIKIRRVKHPEGRRHACRSSLGATHSLPHPPAPAFVRPVDIVTGPAIQPETFGNTFDGRPYHPA
jgi:hypothetical protein